MMGYPGSRDIDHAENLRRKADKLQMLKALIEMHENTDRPDLEYIRKLKFKLRFTQTQFNHMRP